MGLSRRKGKRHARKETSVEDKLQRPEARPVSIIVEPFKTKAGAALAAKCAKLQVWPSRGRRGYANGEKTVCGHNYGFPPQYMRGLFEPVLKALIKQDRRLQGMQLAKTT